MKILGVDPGITGDLAIVETIDVSIVVIDAIDIPTIGSGAKERVDVLAIQRWIEQHRPAFAFVERAQAMPKEGASSTFKYGRALVRSKPRSHLAGSRWGSSNPQFGSALFISRARTRKRRASVRSSCFQPRMLCSHARRTTAALLALHGLRNSPLPTAPPGAQPSMNNVPEGGPS